MCLQKFRNIFYPTNIFGSDSVQFKKVDLKMIPTQGSPMSGYKVIKYYWVGEELEITYTQVKKVGANYETIPHVDVRKNSPGWNNQFNIDDVPGINYPSGYELFFRCTNVTSLIVNGQVLI